LSGRLLLTLVLFTLLTFHLLLLHALFLLLTLLLVGSRFLFLFGFFGLVLLT
jgi:hypothetical protein